MRVTFKERVKVLKETLRKVGEELEGIKFSFEDEDQAKKRVLGKAEAEFKDELKKLETAREVEELVQVVHDNLPLIKECIDVAKPELVDIIKTVLDYWVEIKQSLEQERKDLFRQKAKALYQWRQALVEAGFSKREARKSIYGLAKRPSIFTELLKNIQVVLPQIQKSSKKD